ncbi:hypothetical protein BDK51DRAFT_33135 [Blyttiomyces helicus]|uniref:Uncharacterized protein n=1 Tax=Blyttiomyces helicus TaxID=388810 RepID=A0A4P9WMD6_9FUNG|nr:hypothetical protein BDK51DRAFT_33135 [Blyttiomyces helicus]|eukprot:RKO92340.1 hypothetical protein BDK51DRAFT_33135 [Blyttiomyces helicus]
MSLLLFDKGVKSQTYLNTTDPEGTDGDVPAGGGTEEEARPISKWSHDELSDLEEDKAGKENLQPQLQNNSTPAAVHDGGVRDEDVGRKSDSPEKGFAVDGIKIAEGFIHGQVTKASRLYHVHVAQCGYQITEVTYIIGGGNEKGLNNPER